MATAEEAYAKAQAEIARVIDAGGTRLDLNALATGPLETLPPEIAQATSVTRLSLRNTQVADLSPLAQMTGMTELYLTGTEVADLSPLTQMTGMTTLELDNTQVADLSHLAQMTGMATLDLTGTEVADLSHLAQMTGMTALYLGRTQVTDLSPLAQMTGMTNLSLSSTQVTDLSTLAQMTGMTALYLDGLKPKDFGLVWQMTKLEELSLTNTPFADLGALQNLPNLRQLWIDSTQVANLRGLLSLSNLENGQSIVFRDTPATQADPKLAEIAEISDYEERIRTLYAYLREVGDDWPPKRAVAEPETSEEATPPVIQTAQAQVAFLLEHAAVSQVQLTTTAEQIRMALRDVSPLPGHGNRLPDILAIAVNVATVFDRAGAELANPSRPDLEARIAELEAQVTALTEKLGDAEARAEAAEALAKSDGAWSTYKKGLGEEGAKFTYFCGRVGLISGLIYTLGATHPIVVQLLNLLSKI